MQISISPEKTARTLFAIAMALITASLLGQIYRYTIGGEAYLVFLFNADQEANVTTWFASVGLAMSGVILAVIAWVERVAARPAFRHWAGLSLIFFGLSLDEMIQFHERLTTPTRSAVGADGLLHFAWVLPAAGALAVLSLVFARFVLALPTGIRMTFCAAGALYVGGAVGVEMLGGYYVDTRGQDQLAYALLANIEELLEMSGIALFVFGLLTHLRSLLNGVSFGEPEPPTGARERARLAPAIGRARQPA